VLKCREISLWCRTGYGSMGRMWPKSRTKMSPWPSTTTTNYQSSFFYFWDYYLVVFVVPLKTERSWWRRHRTLRYKTVTGFCWKPVQTWGFSTKIGRRFVVQVRCHRLQDLLTLLGVLQSIFFSLGDSGPTGSAWKWDSHGRRGELVSIGYQPKGFGH